jgi:hypothetical protein
MLECGLFSVSAYHDLTGVLDRLGLRVRGALVNAAAVAFGRESSSMSGCGLPGFMALTEASPSTQSKYKGKKISLKVTYKCRNRSAP